MAEPIAEPAVVSSHSAQAKARPIGHAAVPATLKATSAGKQLDGFMRSEPIISTAEHSPFRPPQAAQIAQPQPPGASPVSAQSAETPLPPDAVMSRPGATIVAQAETSPMPALSFAELSVTPANATVEILPPIHPRFDHAPRVIQVIADAARALQDRPVEVTLNPEELGRVRLTLRSVDGSMSVSVAVERPETLDLLRRNIDMLASP